MCKTWRVEKEAIAQARSYSKRWPEKEIFICKEDDEIFGVSYFFLDSEPDDGSEIREVVKNGMILN